MPRIRCLAWIAIALGCGGDLLRASDGVPAKGSRIIVIGDSITQAGHYVTYLDAFLKTRYPELEIHVRNHGISSETISGTSEPDHDPRRPQLFDRYQRDVAAWKPHLIIACYGMNDGNYHPPDPVRLRLFRRSVRELHQRLEPLGASLLIVTPPPYDIHRRQVGDPEARFYGYQYPYPNYNQTLQRYSDWLLQWDAPRSRVADAHGLITRHLQARRYRNVSFHLSGDGIHPNRTGHWLMTQAILEAWGVTRPVADAALAVEPIEVRRGAVRDLEVNPDAIRLTWNLRLPMPIDPAWDTRSLEREQFAERWNRQRLRIEGLEHERYRLLATREGKGFVEIAEVARADFEAGLDLNEFPDFPTLMRAQEVFEALTALRRDEYRAWRKAIDAGLDREPSADRAAFDHREKMIRNRCRPLTIELRLEPIE